MDRETFQSAIFQPKAKVKKEGFSTANVLTQKVKISVFELGT